VATSASTPVVAMAKGSGSGTRYLAQEGGGGRRVLRPARAVDVPLVDLRLQVVADIQQGAVADGGALEQVGGAGPEALGADVEARKHLGLDEIGQFLCDLKSGARRHRHGRLPWARL
jgi:hypothetical protein